MLATAAAVLAATIAASPASACCGLLVRRQPDESASPVSVPATRVTLLRVGTDVVQSIAPEYEGPPADLALVVPVLPTVRRDDVRSLPRSIFDRLDAITAPRLAECWEQDPCDPLVIGGMESGPRYWESRPGGVFAAGGSSTVDQAASAQSAYDITILGARASSAVERWLVDHGYTVPDGASEQLEPYVGQGMSFVVARLAADRLSFENGRARLPGLRIHRRDHSASLATRISQTGPARPRDLLVYALTPGQRMEAASHAATTLATNLELRPTADVRLGDVYESVFTATLARHPDSVVTEYAWPAGECPYCDGARALSHDELLLLGEDVAPRPRPDPVVQSWQDIISRVRMPPPTVTGPLTVEAARRVSRRHVAALRACYDDALRSDPRLSGSAIFEVDVAPEGDVHSASVRGDIVRASETLGRCMTEELRSWRYDAASEGSRVIAPITLTSSGSGEIHERTIHTDPTPFVLTRMRHRRRGEADERDLSLRFADPIVGGRDTSQLDEFERRAMPADANEFQVRFVIRHPWEGPIDCENPERGRYGPRPEGTDSRSADATRAPLGGSLVELARVLARPEPSLGVEALAPTSESPPSASPSAASAEDRDRAESPIAASPPAQEPSCGCRVPGAPHRCSWPVWLVALGALFAARIRRRAALTERGSRRHADRCPRRSRPIS